MLLEDLAAFKGLDRVMRQTQRQDIWRWPLYERQLLELEVMTSLSKKTNITQHRSHKGAKFS